MRCRASLGQAITLLDRDLEASPDSVDKLFCQGGCARVHHPDRAEIVLFDYGMLAKQKNDWRYYVGKGDLEVLDKAAEVYQVEFWHDNEFETLVDG